MNNTTPTAGPEPPEQDGPAPESAGAAAANLRLVVADPEDRDHALACLRFSRGKRVSMPALRDAFGSLRFGEILRSLQDTKPAEREGWFYTIARNFENRDPVGAGAFRSAIEGAERIYEAEPDDPEPDRPDERPPFSLGLIGTSEFFGAEYRHTWLAKRLLVEGETCLLGGPSKSMKTSTALDMAISLASGTPCLGYFDVPNAVPVFFISGESGPKTLQATARTICRDRQIPWESLERLHWGFVLPRITEDAELDTLRREIECRKAKVVFLDPVYLMMETGANKFDAANMFSVGPLLAKLSAACLDVGATPILLHHSKKHRENPKDPMDLSELAYSGFAQYARQWILVNRRSPYEPNAGIHHLYFVWGGSANHGGLLDLDINGGVMDGDFNGRKWIVTVQSQSQTEAIAADQRARAAKQEQKAAEQQAAKKTQEESRIERNVKKIIGALQTHSDKLHGPPNRTVLMARSKLSGSQFLEAVMELIDSGRAVREEIKSPKGDQYTLIVYRLVPPPAST